MVEVDEVGGVATLDGKARGEETMGKLQ